MKPLKAAILFMLGFNLIIGLVLGFIYLMRSGYENIAIPILLVMIEIVMGVILYYKFKDELKENKNEI